MPTDLKLLFYLVFVIVEALFVLLVKHQALYTFVVEGFRLWAEPRINYATTEVAIQISITVVMSVVIVIEPPATKERFPMRSLGCTAGDQIVPIRRLWRDFDFQRRRGRALSWSNTMSRINVSRDYFGPLDFLSILQYTSKINVEPWGKRTGKITFCP